jgi:hypothetical protein
MDVKSFGLDKITEIYNRFDTLIDDSLCAEHPLLKYRINNLFCYFTNILNEFENISNDYNNRDNKEYIENELNSMIQIEELINKIHL